MKKKSFGSNIFNIINTCIMIFVIIITLYPFIYVASVSISEQYAVLTNKVRLFPVGFDTTAYSRIFADNRIWVSYSNTIKYTLVGTMLNIIVTSMMAYGLSKKSLSWRRPILMLVTFTMMFNGGIIPLYLVVMRLNLLNSIWSVTLPVLVSTYNLLVMRTFFEGVPESLAESAHIDGANELQTFIKIFVPLSKPVILVIGLYYMVGHWNSYFNAMIFLKNPNKYPLQLLLRNIVIGNELTTQGDVTEGAYMVAGESLKAAVIMLATLPIIIVYPFIQKYFVDGVMIGAIKG